MAIMDAHTPPCRSTDLVQRSLLFHLEFARRLVGDLEPAQMTLVPGAGHENHPAFTLGHLVTGLDMTSQDLGLPSELPPGWAELFSRRGPSDRRLPQMDASYPKRDELLDELARQTHRVVDALDGADPVWLAAESEPWKLSAFLPTNMDCVLFMTCAHSSMHLGQLAAWRRAVGLPAAMAQM